MMNLSLRSDNFPKISWLVGGRGRTQTQLSPPKPWLFITELNCIQFATLQLQVGLSRNISSFIL